MITDSFDYIFKRAYRKNGTLKVGPQKWDPFPVSGFWGPTLKESHGPGSHYSGMPLLFTNFF